MNHIPFPDIAQYRNVIRNVRSRAQYTSRDQNGDPIYDPLKPLPSLEFEGTVKLHGTNAAICRGPEGFWFQSRERILTATEDNAGFHRFFNDHPDVPLRLFDQLPANAVGIFGEWCGQGIMKGTGISCVPKMLVIFAVKLEDGWASRDIVEKVSDPENRVFNIYSYPTFQIQIDFANPELAQNALGELTLEVEKCCPVAREHGIDGVGEGIVWKCITPGWEDPQFWMKVKGEKHSISKVKTLAPIDIEKVKSQKEFVEKTVTDARCQQSIAKLKEAGKPLDRTSLGDFIRWIYHDIIKEETDTAEANGIDLEKIGGFVAQSAKSWFFANEVSFS